MACGVHASAYLVVSLQAQQGGAWVGGAWVGGAWVGGAWAGGAWAGGAGLIPFVLLKPTCSLQLDVRSSIVMLVLT